MSVKKELKKINKMRLNHEYSKATEKLRDLLKEHPDNFDILWELAKVYFDSEKEQTGVATLRQILKNYPERSDEVYDLLETSWRVVKNPDTLLWFMWELKVQERLFEEAQKVIAKMGKDDINAQLLTYTQRVDELEKYKDESQIDETDINFYFFPALLNINLGNYDEAFDYFKKIIDIKPDELEHVKKIYQEEAAENPENSDIYLRLSDLNFLSADKKEAIDSLIEFAEKDKDNVDIAIVKLEEVHDQHPDDATVIKGLAELYLLNERFEKALIYFTRFIQKFPEKTDAITPKLDEIKTKNSDIPLLYLAYVDVHLNKENLDEVIENLGIALDKTQKNYEQLLDYANRAEEKFPESNDIKLILVNIYEEKDDVSTALDYLQEIVDKDGKKWRKKVIDTLLNIVKKDESNVEAHDMLGRIYILENQLERATAVYDHLWETHSEALSKIIEGYEKILKKKPSLSDVGIALAKAYIEKEDYQNAVLRLGDVLKNNPQRIKEVAPLLREVIHNDRKQIYLIARFYESLSLKKEVQDNADLALAMAEAYAYEKQIDRATQQLQRFLVLAPDKTKEALELYHDILENDPENISVRFDMVDLFIQEEKYEKATNQLLEIVEIDESSLQKVIERFYKILDKEYSPKAHRALIETYYNHQLIDHAAEECQKVLAESPMDKDSVYAYLILSDAYIEKGLFSEAVDKLFMVLNIDPEVIDEVKRKCRRILELDEANVSARYALAECFIVEEDYDNAVEILTDVLKYDKSRVDSIMDHIQRIINLNHTNVNAHLALGELYIQKGDFDKSAREFTQALELDAKKLDEVIDHHKQILALEPDSVIANFMLGKALVQKENFSEAVQYLAKSHSLNARYAEPVMREYQRIVSLAPQNPDAKFALGKIFVERGLYQKAIDQFSQVVNYHPDWAKDVLSEYKVILKKSPDMGNLYLAMAEAYIAVDDYDQAIEEIAKSLELGQTFLDEAIELLETIISKDSSYSPALLWLAKCYVKKAKYDEASTHYMYALNMDKENLEEVKEGLNEILKVEPDHLMTKMHLGDVYSQTGEYENAKEEFEAALAHAEDKQVKIELYLHLSNIALSMQDEKGSKAYLLEARKLDPENQYLYRQLEKLYYRQLSINIENAEQILKNQPDDEATKVKLAKLYKKNKEFEKAIQTLNFSSDDYQTELQRLSELAQCFLIQKDPYAAINVFSNVRIAHQNHTEWEKDATYWLAISYERVGKLDEALNELEKIYICDPNFRDIAKRKNDIYLAKTQESENILIETV